MSVNIISLNQIIDLFADFADRHYFINDFGYGQPADIGTSRQMEFPYMWVTTTQDSVIRATNKTAIPELRFVVLFMDKTNIQQNYEDINGVASDNVQEVLSDMLQVLQDFITEIQVSFGDYGLMLLEDVNCYPAIDETQDSVNGWVGELSIKIKHSNCILPTGDIVQTNLTPINPQTRYLTCQTVTGCTTLQQYIANAIATGATGTQITGYTYSPSTNTFTIGDSSGSTFSASFNEVSGLTVNGNLNATTISATTYQNLPQDIFVTGGTYSNGTATFTNNSGGTFNVTGFLTGVTDTYTTGYTYSNNTFTIKQNNGQADLTSTINTMTGLTINGNLSVDTITDVEYLDFNLTATTAYNEGRLSWNDDTKTLEIYTENQDVPIEVGHMNVVRVVNKTLSTLNKGRLVYINGAQGNRPTVTLANYSGDSTSARTLGFIADDINNNNNGYVISYGLLRGVNTASYSAGTQLYLYTGGTYTNTRPVAPLHEVRVGVVINQDAVNGIIFVNIMNGYELTELHDVSATTVNNLDILQWNSSQSVWQPTNTPSFNSISATTYYNLPVDPDTYVTGYTYSNNTFTLQRNNGQPNLTATINTVTGLTVNGTLSATTINGDGTNLTGIPRQGAIGVTFDGGGSVITTGTTVYVEVPYNCTITGWTITSDVSGSIVVDVWKDTYANYPPTVADTIAGSEKPTLSSAIKNQDNNLTTWTTSVIAGDIIAFKVDSATTVTRVNVSLRVLKTT